MSAKADKGDRKREIEQSPMKKKDFEFGCELGSKRCDGLGADSSIARTVWGHTSDQQVC